MSETTEVTGTEPPVEPEYKSPEDEALEAVEAEIKAAEAENNDAGDDKQEPAENAEPVPDDGAKQKAPEEEQKAEPTVPLAALHSERTARQAAEAELAQASGYIQAMRDLETSSSANPEEQPPTPEQQIESLRAEQLAVAGRFDDGAVTFAEAEAQRQQLDDQIHAVREQGRQPVVVEQVPQGPDAAVESNMNDLIGRFPIVGSLNQKQLEPFVQQAYQKAQDEGQPIQASALGTIRLHTLTAELAHDHYQKFFPAPVEEAGQPSGDGKELSDTAKAREDKLTLANAQPPNTNQIGSSDTGPLDKAELLSKLNGMEEEAQIEFLEKSGMAQTLLR